jgi:hypothetical protein
VVAVFHIILIAAKLHPPAIIGGRSVLMLFVTINEYVGIREIFFLHLMVIV